MRLLAQGHAVMACVAGWPSVPTAIANLERAGAVVVRRPRATPLWRKGLARLQRQGIMVGVPDPAWSRLVRFKPDLVCVSQGASMCGVDWMLRCKQAGIPYSAICQANYEYWWPNDNVAETARIAYEGCRHTSFVSRRNRSLLEAQLSMTLSRSEIVRNPFLVSYDASPPWPDPGDCLRLACVGRLEPKAKGQDLIIDVLAAEKWRRRGLHVSLFGSGPCHEGLRKLIELRRLQNSVVFAGQVDDVEHIWRTHHAIILASRYEGLPLALVEAMLCGRIGIVTDVAENAEAVTDNETGFVAAAPIPEYLDSAMERAWLRRDEWMSMGRRAAEAIREKVPRDPAALFAAKLSSLAGDTADRLPNQIFTR